MKILEFTGVIIISILIPMSAIWLGNYMARKRQENR